ncbi:hypothetical protein CSUI_002160 [Cystoisospora suis]|uniref:Uncharacterized protein n=1 Tax=Cystoisospora suis TaxID=483139 RepID=A0A2C6KIX8_9APIC|nr:hypothetical protein CSUI_002160 [Cystoisospora suis]
MAPPHSSFSRLSGWRSPSPSFLLSSLLRSFHWHSFPYERSHISLKHQTLLSWRFPSRRSLDPLLLSSSSSPISPDASPEASLYFSLSSFFFSLSPCSLSSSPSLIFLSSSPPFSVCPSSFLNRRSLALSCSSSAPLSPKKRGRRGECGDALPSPRDNTLLTKTRLRLRIESGSYHDSPFSSASPSLYIREMSRCSSSSLFMSSLVSPFTGEKKRREWLSNDLLCSGGREGVRGGEEGRRDNREESLRRRIGVESGEGEVTREKRGKRKREGEKFVTNERDNGGQERRDESKKVRDENKRGKKKKEENVLGENKRERKKEKALMFDLPRPYTRREKLALKATMKEILSPPREPPPSLFSSPSSSWSDRIGEKKDKKNQVDDGVDEIEQNLLKSFHDYLSQFTLTTSSRHEEQHQSMFPTQVSIHPNSSGKKSHSHSRDDLLISSSLSSNHSSSSVSSSPSSPCSLINQSPSSSSSFLFLNSLHDRPPLSPPCEGLHSLSALSRHLDFLHSHSSTLRRCSFAFLSSSIETHPLVHLTALSLRKNLIFLSPSLLLKSMEILLSLTEPRLDEGLPSHLRQSHSSTLSTTSSLISLQKESLSLLSSYSSSRRVWPLLQDLARRFLSFFLDDIHHLHPFASLLFRLSIHPALRNKLRASSPFSSLSHMRRCFPEELFLSFLETRGIYQPSSEGTLITLLHCLVSIAGAHERRGGVDKRECGQERETNVIDPSYRIEDILIKIERGDRFLIEEGGVDTALITQVVKKYLFPDWIYTVHPHTMAVLLLQLCELNCLDESMFLSILDALLVSIHFITDRLVLPLLHVLLVCRKYFDLRIAGGSESHLFVDDSSSLTPHPVTPSLSSHSSFSFSSHPCKKSLPSSNSSSSLVASRQSFDAGVEQEISSSSSTSPWKENPRSLSSERMEDLDLSHSPISRLLPPPTLLNLATSSSSSSSLASSSLSSSPVSSPFLYDGFSPSFDTSPFIHPLYTERGKRLLQALRLRVQSRMGSIPFSLCVAEVGALFSVYKPSEGLKRDFLNQCLALDQPFSPKLLSSPSLLVTAFKICARLNVSHGSQIRFALGTGLYRHLSEMNLHQFLQLVGGGGGGVGTLETLKAVICAHSKSRIALMETYQRLSLQLAEVVMKYYELERRRREAFLLDVSRHRKKMKEEVEGRASYPLLAEGGGKGEREERSYGENTFSSLVSNRSLYVSNQVDESAKGRSLYVGEEDEGSPKKDRRGFLLSDASLSSSLLPSSSSLSVFRPSSSSSSVVAVLTSALTSLIRSWMALGLGKKRNETSLPLVLLLASFSLSPSSSSSPLYPSLSSSPLLSSRRLQPLLSLPSLFNALSLSQLLLLVNAYRRMGILMPPRLAKSLLHRLNRSGGIIDAQGAADILYTLSVQQLLSLPFSSTSSPCAKSSLSPYIPSGPSQDETLGLIKEEEKTILLPFNAGAGEEEEQEEKPENDFPTHSFKGGGGVYRQLFDSVCTALWEENYTLLDSSSSSPTAENLIYIFWSLVASERWQWVERLSLPIVEYCTTHFHEGLHTNPKAQRLFYQALCHMRCSIETASSISPSSRTRKIPPGSPSLHDLTHACYQMCLKAKVTSLPTQADPTLPSKNPSSMRIDLSLSSRQSSSVFSSFQEVEDNEQEDEEEEKEEDFVEEIPQAQTTSLRWSPRLNEASSPGRKAIEKKEEEVQERKRHGTRDMEEILSPSFTTYKRTTWWLEKKREDYQEEENLCHKFKMVHMQLNTEKGILNALMQNTLLSHLQLSTSLHLLSSSSSSSSSSSPSSL